MTLAVSVLVTLAAPATALAGEAPGTVPDITSPAPGAYVSFSPVTVSATSTATKVKFTVGGSPEIATVVADVVGGIATAELPAFGAAGITSLNAYDCDATPTCNSVGDTSTIDVDLFAPTITSPSNNKVVGSSITVRVTAPGGGLQFLLDGDVVGTDLSGPFEKQISLDGKSEGRHTITVKQCNAAGEVCDGKSDRVDVIKDTKTPNWSDVSTSNGTVYPVKDNFKDSTQLSARVNEDLKTAEVEIRKAGGPIVRTIKMGRVSEGRAKAVWSGRRSNGDIVPNGKYTFRFIGIDQAGLVGKSSDKVVHVSDKKLVKKTVTRTVSAKSSFYRNLSGACSGVYSLDYRQAKYDWPKGAGYYSRSTCNGSANDDTALALHRVAAPQAVRYGAMRIDTYGGGAVRHAGPGVILYIKGNGDTGAGRVTKQSLAWHSGPSVAAQTYVKNGRVVWAFGAVRGNWFDVKEYRLTFRISVLQ